MFVSRNGCAKRDVSQVLQSVGESVVRGISSFPEPVPLGKSLRRKSGQSQQVVRSVFDHVDSQVIPRVDVKIRTVCIAKRQSFKFEKTIKRRVFHPLKL